jgi:hypothetical protein
MVLKDKYDNSIGGHRRKMTTLEWSQIGTLAAHKI